MKIYYKVSVYYIHAGEQFFEFDDKKDAIEWARKKHEDTGCNGIKIWEYEERKRLLDVSLDRERLEMG